MRPWLSTCRISGPMFEPQDVCLALIHNTCQVVNVIEKTAMSAMEFIMPNMCKASTILRANMLCCLIISSMSPCKLGLPLQKLLALWLHHCWARPEYWWLSGASAWAQPNPPWLNVCRCICSDRVYQVLLFTHIQLLSVALLTHSHESWHIRWCSVASGMVRNLCGARPSARLCCQSVGGVVVLHLPIVGPLLDWVLIVWQGRQLCFKEGWSQFNCA